MYGSAVPDRAQPPVGWSRSIPPPPTPAAVAGYRQTRPIRGWSVLAGAGGALALLLLGLMASPSGFVPAILFALSALIGVAVVFLLFRGDRGVATGAAVATAMAASIVVLVLRVISMVSG